MIRSTAASLTENDGEPILIIGWPIVAIVAIIAFAFFVYRLVRNKEFRSFTAKAGPVSVDLQAFERIEKHLEFHGEKLEAIDHAVNQTEPGDPTLRETVESHSGQIAAIQADVSTISTTLSEGLAAVNARLDRMAELASKHHPEDPSQ